MKKKNRRLILSEIRDRNGYTRKRFAEEIGIPLRTIEDIEKRGSTTNDRLQSFVDFFKLDSIDDLFCEEYPDTIENLQSEPDVSVVVSELEKEMAEFIEDNNIGQDEPAYQYYHTLQGAKFDSAVDFLTLLENFGNADEGDFDRMTKLQITDFFCRCEKSPNESERTIRTVLANLQNPKFDISISKIQMFAIALRESNYVAESNRLFEEAIYRKKSGARID